MNIIDETFGNLGNVVKLYYNEPHRFYHTTRHISRMLLDAIHHGIKLNGAQQLAVLFHDVVYIPGNTDNERNSADVMLTLFAQYPSLFSAFTAEDVKFARYIILDTKTHRSELECSDVVLDLDLLGLADSYDEYSLTGVSIRKEFAMVEDHVWQVGRLKFLESMLNRDVIFHTPTFRSYEERARFNLTTELNELIKS